MGTSTPNYNLFKPDANDLVNVETDLATNYDKLDAHAHSGTYVSWTDVTNPLYGAVGDGTTNDAAAITAAIAAAPTGGVLYFPPNKTYKVTTAVAITKSLVVYGPGATIKSTGGTNSLITVTGVDGLLVDGLAFDGNYSTKTLGSGLFVSTSTNVRVLRCKFVNIPEHAVALTNCQRVWVLGNYFSSSGASAVRLMDPGGGNHNDDIWIEDNHVLNPQLAAVSGNAGIQSHGTGAVTHRRVSVARNRVLGGRVGIGMDSLDDSFIVDNVIVGGGVGGEGIAFTGSGNLVRGNNVTGNGTGTAACILLWGVATRTNQRNTIANNTCTNGAQGVAYVYGENATTINDNTISGNTCWSNGYGIQSYSGVGVTTGQTEKNNLITDNDVIGNSSGAINTISASGSPPPSFNNRTSDGEIKILQRFSSPFDGISVLGGVGGAGGVHNGINVRHLDSSSSSGPEIRFEGRFDATENVKAGGMGTRRTGASGAGTVETYLYGYTGAAIIEAFKARADGSLEIEGTGLYNGQHLVLGGYHIWLDAGGNLRFKSSAPASAADGFGLLNSNVVQSLQSADFSILGATVAGTPVQLGTIAPSITIGSGSRVLVRTTGMASVSGTNTPLERVRLSIDSGASTYELGRIQGNSVGFSLETSVIISGLSAAAHTIKVEVEKTTATNLFIRPTGQPLLERFGIILQELPA